MHTPLFDLESAMLLSVKRHKLMELWKMSGFHPVL